MRQDWIETELGQVCDIKMGQSPPSSTYNNEKKGLPFFQGKAEFTELYPVVKKWCSGPKKAADVNDILLSVRAPVGATNMANQKCAIGRGLAAISYPQCNKYILYFLKLIERQLDEQGTGTTFKAISGNTLKSQIIPFAPLPEQRAIVSKIEKLFSDLDNGIANLKEAKAKLDIYRQAVLKKAFEGELTKTSTSSIDIKIVSLGSLIEKPKYGTSKKCHPEPKGKPVLRIPNIGKGLILHDDLKYADFEEKEIENLRLKEGDLLTIRSNGSVDLVGKCALVRKVDSHYLYAGYLIRLRPTPEKIDSKYLLYCFSSHALRVQIESKAKSTSGVNNINSGELESLQIPFSPLADQKAIVEAIESRLSVCDKLAEDINQGLEKAEALRQSILKKAFSGKLLSDEELEECRREPDWEPADKLLKRIKKG